MQARKKRPFGSERREKQFKANLNSDTPDWSELIKVFRRNIVPQQTIEDCFIRCMTQTPFIDSDSDESALYYNTLESERTRMNVASQFENILGMERMVELGYPADLPNWYGITTQGRNQWVHDNVLAPQGIERPAPNHYHLGSD
jgi:hypothetical protein